MRRLLVLPVLVASCAGAGPPPSAAWPAPNLDLPSVAPRPVRVEVVSVTVAPCKTNGETWDGLGATDPSCSHRHFGHSACLQGLEVTPGRSRTTMFAGLGGARLCSTTLPQ